jgi:UDP-glucuronate 4-epimerase
MRRDFTFIDDIVAGVLGALDCGFDERGPQDDPPHRMFNLGNHTPVELEHFIDVIGQAAGKPVHKVYKPMQPGDMVETMADTSRAQAAFGFEPQTSIESGLPRVVDWCRHYFGDAA